MQSALMVCCVGLAVYLNLSICNLGGRRLGRRLRERGIHTIIYSLPFEASVFYLEGSGKGVIWKVTRFSSEDPFSFPH